MLRGMVSSDKNEQAAAWDTFWGALNHQGDFYDSTVAVIPFLIEALDHRHISCRANILESLRQRWLDAPEYGGDPIVPNPPGGIDEPTPLRPDLNIEESDDETSDEAEEIDISVYRRMDLCAWQTGRAIQAGRPTFERLLEDPDRVVAAGAAKLLLLWSETRQIAKQSLIRFIEQESDSHRQGERILEFGVYADEADLSTLDCWITPARSVEMRAAAALTWTWVINPRQVPEPVLSALHDCSTPTATAFGNLPWVGIYHRGPWILPANVAHIILRMAESNNKDVRWRAIQGLNVTRETARYLSADQVIPVLMRALNDPHNRIRDAAAYALSQRGEAVLVQHNLPALINALEIREPTNWEDRNSTSANTVATWTSDFAYSSLDNGAATCGHIARLLATFSDRLDSTQRKQAVAAVQRAIHHFTGKQATVMFDSMGIDAAPFLNEQLGLLRAPREWGLQELLVPFAFPNMQESRLSPEECERRLAEMVAQDSEATISGAVEVVRDAKNRNAALGAVHWLMTLGPAAERALPEIDKMATGILDSYAKDEAKRAAEFIRKAMAVETDVSPDSNLRSKRNRIASLLRLEPSNQLGLLQEVEELLENEDAYVRAGAAEAIANWAPPLSASPEVIRKLVNLMSDEAAVDVGVPGPFEFEGRVSHWRRERRSPRASALRALFVLDSVPQGELFLRAMLAETEHAALVIAQQTVPCRFPIGQWRRAVSAAGGLAIAEPQLRTFGQSCREHGWSGKHSAFAAESELAVVIRQLSGRLI
jgi:HEAT repeat protein